MIGQAVLQCGYRELLPKWTRPPPCGGQLTSNTHANDTSTDRRSRSELKTTGDRGRMDRPRGRRRSAALPADAGLQRLHESDTCLDFDRVRRTGDPEVVFGTGKTPRQVVRILEELHAAHPHRAILATRLEAEATALVATALPAASIDRRSRTVTLGPMPSPRGVVSIVCAGTSDEPVAREAAVTAEVFGASAEVIMDVGIAGLHRILGVQKQLDRADCVVVIAGMEGALASVVGGLTGVPVVAVPTSVGYGASFEGLAALLAMLNSCAPGVTVVNIDNGFGAAVFAARVARRTAVSPTAHRNESG
jgi:NCAIR mutase (PurE)-related protein